MRKSFALFVPLLIATAAFGQYRGGNTFGSLGGFGSVVYPGTGHPPPPGSFSIANPGFARGLAGTVNGSLPYRGVGRGYGGYRNGALPYVYGVVGGYGYGYVPDYSYGYPPPGQPAVVAAPPQAPQVVINQTFVGGAPAPGTPEASDAIHFFQPAPAQPAADAQPADTPYYLIAYKDHSIYSARAYWVENNTLHYITTQNTHNQASLDLIDVDFTKKLNGDRNVQFTINR